jgi:histidine triad (HIT) family protein
MSEDCVFCKIVQKKIPADVVYEDDEVLAFKDLNAKAPVHLLFIPKRHISSLNELEEDDENVLGRILVRIKETARSLGIDGAGYRVVMNCNKDGGQEVFHLHFHLLGGRHLGWPPG